MEVNVIFLGTSAGIPTNSRGLPAIAIRRKGELFLLDCGEGTQRQMLTARIGFCRRTKIFISHMHGDHLFGLPGLLQTMALLGRSRPLEIYGPKGIGDFVKTSIGVARPSNSYAVDVHEVDAGLVDGDGDLDP